MISFLLIIFIALSLFSIIRLLQAFRTRHYTQSVIFFIVLALCVYKVIDLIRLQSLFNKQINEDTADIFEDIKAGDTTVFSGWVMFRKYDPAWEDTIKKSEIEESRRTGRWTFTVTIPSIDTTQWYVKWIESDVAAYDSLYRYFDYNQQLKDSTTYRFMVKGVKLDYDHSWKLLQIIRVDTLRELPHYWQ